MSTKGWSKQELELLEIYYPLGNAKLCKEKGIDRGIKAIRSKAFKLGLTNPHYKKRDSVWSEEELELLREYYPKGGLLLCRENGLLKGDFEIYYKAGREGLKIGSGRGLSKNNWTEEEINLLKEFYPKGGLPLCRKQGLKRSKDSTYVKVKELKLNRFEWTDEAISIIKEYYPLGGAVLCQRKGVDFSKYKIVTKAKELGVEYKKYNKYLRHKVY